MRDRSDYKSRILSSQKPRKRRTKSRPTRDRIDLMDLHMRIAMERRQIRSAKSRWIKVALFVIIIVAFFLLGYLIASLSVPIWAKILLFIFIATLALMVSEIMIALLS